MSGHAADAARKGTCERSRPGGVAQPDILPGAWLIAFAPSRVAILGGTAESTRVLQNAVGNLGPKHVAALVAHAAAAADALPMGDREREALVEIIQGPAPPLPDTDDRINAWSRGRGTARRKPC